LSFILTGSILLAIFASKRFYPNTNTLAAFLSLQSVALFFLWTY
jgi:hypothetical protein